MANVNAKVEAIGPDEAAKILEGCTKNRDVSQRIVDRYSKAMDEGKWALNGESVVIGKDGRLVDGQHRLWAVIQSGRTVDFLVVRGVDPDAFETCDQGMNRTPTHALQAAGVPGAAPVAAILRFRDYYKRNAGKLPSITSLASGRIDHGDIIRTASGNQVLEMAAHWFYRVKRTNKSIPAGPFGALAYLASSAGQIDDVDGFLDGFCDIERSLPDVREFHNHVMRASASKFRNQWGHIVMFGILIKTHNAVATGKPIKVFRITQDEPFPAVYGLRGSGW